MVTVAALLRFSAASGLCPYMAKPTMTPETITEAVAVTEPLVNIDAAAALLGVSTRTVARLYGRRDLEVVRVGSSVRFRQAALREYIDRAAAGPAPGGDWRATLRAVSYDAA